MAAAWRTPSLYMEKHLYQLIYQRPRFISFLKQHCVTLTATCGLEKQKLTMHINMLHKTAILVKLGHILRKICPLVFPPMSCECCVFAAFYFATPSPTTTLLQLQLQLAGSMLLSGYQNFFQNLTEIAVLCNVLMCVLSFIF